MGNGETRIGDARGKFAWVIRDGRPIDEANWTDGRILLSNKRLILVGQNGKRNLALDAISDLGDRFDVNQSIARVSNYVSLRCDEDVLLVAPNDIEAFEPALYTALLDSQVVLVRHPAVEGGVMQDTEWSKARVKPDEEGLNVAMADGEFLPIELAQIGGVDRTERSVLDEERAVVEVEHAEESTSVQTYFAGPDRLTSFIQSFLAKGEEQTSADLDLEEADKEVLMALYSGVSPFEIPDFTGLDVEQVEERFDWLVEREVLEEVRTRSEVTLTARGRNLASEAIDGN